MMFEVIYIGIYLASQAFLLFNVARISIKLVDKISSICYIVTYLFVQGRLQKKNLVNHRRKLHKITNEKHDCIAFTKILRVSLEFQMRL